MDNETSQNILKALLLICKRLDEMSDSLSVIADTLQAKHPNPEQGEIN